MAISLQSYHKKCMGYTKKRCIPKEGMPHAPKACQKKEKREKENIAHTKNITREREIICRSFIHHPPKISTHLHILIKVYDLFLLLIRSFDLAKYEKQVCHYILHTYRSTKKKPLEVGWKKKAHKNTLVRNETHWAIREITRGTYKISFQKII